MASLTRENFSTATELADLLVRESGLPFRDAHHLVGAVVRAAMNREMSAEKIDGDFISEIARETFGRAISLSPDAVARAVDPRQAIEARRGSGGPSAHDMGELLDSLESQINRDRGAFDDETVALDNAAARLDAAFRKLAAIG
tara:strand:+ start:61 stop:489 length:429 start_codon:yes stop_codon:yes gene_type:complete